MKIESSLKLVSVKKPKDRNPVVIRRERLLRHINNQIESIKRFKAGEKVENVWFWCDEEGNIFLPIKYGKTVLELAKGKFSISCSSYDDVEENLETVKSLVLRGCLDNMLSEKAQELRMKFRRKAD